MYTSICNKLHNHVHNICFLQLSLLSPFTKFILMLPNNTQKEGNPIGVTWLFLLKQSCSFCVLCFSSITYSQSFVFMHGLIAHLPLNLASIHLLSNKMLEHSIFYSAGSQKKFPADNKIMTTNYLQLRLFRLPTFPFRQKTIYILSF